MRKRERYHTRRSASAKRCRATFLRLRVLPPSLRPPVRQNPRRTKTVRFSSGFYAHVARSGFNIKGYGPSQSQVFSRSALYLSVKRVHAKRGMPFTQPSATQKPFQFHRSPLKRSQTMPLTHTRLKTHFPFGKYPPRRQRKRADSA